MHGEWLNELLTICTFDSELSLDNLDMQEITCFSLCLLNKIQKQIGISRKIRCSIKIKKTDSDLLVIQN